MNSVTNGVDREWGEDPDPRLEQLRRLDEWLSHLTVWQRHLLIVPLAFVIVGIAVWLNSVLPPLDPNLLFPARTFGPLPSGHGRGSWRTRLLSRGVGGMRSKPTLPNGC